ncbi:MAG: hypothetical protein FK734_07895 [Asgard group archaeon]|nr:hypothetical protein [Asgard group archaeon]
MSINKTNLASLIYFTESKIVCTGGVVFVGDGHTGKTHTAINITSYKSRAFYNPEDDSLRKSVNLELDYFIFQSNIEEYLIKTTSQIFIMPGQKGRSKLGEGLAFEDAVDLYFHISPIKVVLALVLTYDLSDMNTFQELEYWLNRAIERDIIQDMTSIIILGTHLDSEDIIVTDDDISAAKTFVHETILDKIGVDIGLDKIHTVKVSNITSEGIDELKQTINNCFLSAFNIFGLLDYKKNNNL